MSLDCTVIDVNKTALNIHNPSINTYIRIHVTLYDNKA